LHEGVGQLVRQHALGSGIDPLQAAERDADLAVEEAGHLAAGLGDVVEGLLGVEQHGDRLRGGVAIRRAERVVALFEIVGEGGDEVLIERSFVAHVEVGGRAEGVVTPGRLLAFPLDDLVPHAIGGLQPERLLPRGDGVVHALVPVPQVAQDLVELRGIRVEGQTVEYDGKRRGVAARAISARA
jgi:hypothetical protein